MADKKISELDQVLQINNDAVFPMSQNSGGTPTTYKASITQLGAEIGEDQTFSNLQTTDKTLVGAINEVAQGGGGGGSSNANLAPDYDATSTYAVGDWCIYNGTLYQCNTAIPTAEAFDPTHWTAKKVVDAFADIEDELYDKVDTTDFYATNLPIESGSATDTKSYIDSKTAVSDIASSLTLDTNYFTASTKQVYKSGNTVNICLRGSLTATNGAILGTIATYYPKASRIICDFYNNGAPTPITTGAVWLNGENGRIFYFGGSVTSLDVCITVTYICN